MKKIELRKKEPKRSRGRPRTKNISKSETKTPALKVFSLIPEKKAEKTSMNRLTMLMNTLVTLNISRNDILKYDEQMKRKNSKTFLDEPQPFNGQAFNYVQKTTSSKKEVEKKESLPPKTKKIPNHLKESSIKQRNLIINSGISKKVSNLMSQFSEEKWPNHSSYVCWHCCHNFENAPVGIPENKMGETFYLYGNFCSYNCALSYMYPSLTREDKIKTMDDWSLQQSSFDHSVMDNLSEQHQLLEFLCHIETGKPLDTFIKPAPCRLTLKIFGGTKTIQEYRHNFDTNEEYCVFKSPMVPIIYQLEESSYPMSTNTSTKTRKSKIQFN